MATALPRPTARPRSAVATIMGLVMMAGVLIASAATPAQAATYCPPPNDHQVVGDIEQRYIAMGGPEGALGCPLTGELVNPDGEGRRTQFEGGTIYWSPSTGAWPVWGHIGEQWCLNGCEAGWMGYPTSYEYTVGDEIRQNFECTVWHFRDLGGGTTQLWHDGNICV